MKLYSFRERMFRTKHLPPGSLETEMKRCLNTFDITLLGVGHMIGAGIYVLTGHALKDIAGPSIVLAFALAGFASLLSALCYAEFGARFPKAGSAYTYAYVGVGEFWAFVIGWNVVLEHMLSAAAVARSWSGYLNALTNDWIKNTTVHTIGEMNFTYFGDYLDIVAFIVACFIAFCVGIGSKGSTRFNSFFTLLNLCVIVVVVGFGFRYADFSLWSGETENGVSKFFPFGFAGTLAGAASCFFAFVGFDGLATAGEEARNPSRAIPLSTFYCMGIVTVAYVSMAAALALMVPYTDIDVNAAFATAFQQRGSTIAKWAVSLGAICGMTTSMFGSMFSLPRCVYAMAQDGLIFRWLSRVHGTTRVPVNAIVVFGLMTAVIASLVNVNTLVDFLSLGTLLAYSIVAACVIILRYQHDLSDTVSDDHPEYFRLRFPGSGTLEKLSMKTGIHIALTIMLFGFIIFGLSFTTGLITHWFGIFLAIIGALLSMISFFWICVYKQNNVQLAFKVRFVPFIPALSLFCNSMMMLNLPGLAWIRLAIWMTIGMAIYLLYGMRHSTEEETRKIADSSNPQQQSVKVFQNTPIKETDLEQNPKNDTHF
ncbi:unnamed protein product, partial [Mesorhabditis belari]|uniref:Cationic amino acid transporter C-terminal domain-containing protein n=1 Tax=Mesorhabditis belari TaxID=2138241 RepID=A0AAF3JAS8_9BILA